jgi:hypothetical protein
MLTKGSTGILGSMSAFQLIRANLQRLPWTQSSRSDLKTSWQQKMMGWRLSGVPIHASLTESVEICRGP